MAPHVEPDNPRAAAELLPLVYAELRRLAARKLANEPPGQTLQPTALVHEAWLRLGGPSEAKFANPAHFFAAAAEAMRRILVENARRKQRQKHGGGREEADHLLAVDEALDRLAALDALAADLIKLRFFAGLPNVEAARLLGLPERTAKRTWAYARAWLYAELKRAL